jgi:response regulator RpfG family c-di-GMP phosphodiesterase
VSTSRHSVLIVDDESSILKVLGIQITRAGYEPVAASSAAEALDHARKRTFSVVITDYQMPEMTGAEFLREFAKIQPNTSRILITGLRSLEVVASAVNSGEIFRFLTKPWVGEEMLATLQNAVHRYELLESKLALEQTTHELNHKLAEANLRLEQQVRDLARQKELLDESRAALQQNFDRSLELCHRIIGTFNPLLGAQAKAAVHICESLAEPPRFTAEEKHALIVSAHLYDIGLTGVPHDYTQAVQSGDPSRLPAGIQHLVRNHTLYGQTLASFVDDLKSVGDTIRWHHERIDGKGYPDGLAGEMIPWSARCLAVVAYYVSCGAPHDVAVERILAQSGTAFDPEAVRLFLRSSGAKPPPAQVREVLLDELSPGMLLATGIYSPTGILLIPEGHRLDDSTIAKIRNHSHLTSLPQQLLVYC